MPDRWSFDHLGEDVRCIECGEGGPNWQWPEKARARHSATHAQARQAQVAREQRARLYRYRTELRRERALQRRAGLT